MSRLPLKLVLILLLLAFITGCGSDAEDVGVVARVNGHPIYLTELETKYDLAHLDAAPAAPPSPDTLKAEYMSILKELIAQQLVLQVLREKGMPVSEDEMNMAEAKVRMDYPKGGFERVLIEEYIDLDMWRTQLVAYLSYEKFLNKILKPKVVITEKEIALYYRKNKADFVLPARIDFCLVKGPELAAVKRALKLLAKGASLEKMRERFQSIETRRLVLPKSRLPERIGRILDTLKPGQSSSVNAAEVGFEGFLLQQRLPEKQQQLSDVKKEVVQLVMEKKLRRAYISWLENELVSSKISISEYLLNPQKIASRTSERQRKAFDIGPDASGK